MTRLLKQGRILSALAGAVLFFLLAGCNDGGDAADSDVPLTAEQAASSLSADEIAKHDEVMRHDEVAKLPGIGPDSEEGGELMYEEVPSLGLSDYIGRIDYSVAQAMQRSGLKSNALRVATDGLVEHKGHLYHAQTLEIYEVKDAPLFAQTLRDALLAWAEHAVLLPDEAEPSGGAWQILLDDAVTHKLRFFSGPAPLEAAPPCLVIVIDDLGESKRQAQRLLALDYPVTFAVWPHSTHAKSVAGLARKAGAEVIIHQPMEPEGYPAVKPGKGVLLSGMSREEITAILDENLALVPFASGLNNHMGSRLTQDEESMRFVAEYLQPRGFLLLDSLTHAKSRFAKAAAKNRGRAFKRDIFLDVEADKSKVLTQLHKAEQMALIKGQAIAIGHPLAVTLEALEEWGRTRDRQVSIVRLKDLSPIALPVGSPTSTRGNFD